MGDKSLRMRMPDLQKIADDFDERAKDTISITGVEPELTTFPQMWGSTALGFEGFGGSALTTAYTSVVWCVRSDVYAVYFDKDFAYLIEAPNKYFFDDMLNHRMASVSESGKYRRKDI
jgi:hypothetical protein